MSRFMIKTITDSVDADVFQFLSETMLEVGYTINGKFYHEIIKSDYYRIVDNYPTITFEELKKKVENRVVSSNKNTPNCGT
jgi:hypothetical protein